MKNIIVVDYTTQALAEFIKFSYKENYCILNTQVKEEIELVYINIKENNNIIWEHEDIKGNKYVNMSSFSKLF